jgi:hypothetical protein
MQHSLSFPVISFRNLETPFRPTGYKDYYAVVRVQDLPDLSAWRKINVRDPKLTGAVPKAIREGFNEKPDLFLFMNRGIVLSVEKVYFDSAKSDLKIILTDPNVHGLLDGGHTYNIILEERKPDVNQYVKVEILEGLNSEEITDVVDARNTSNQVRDESLMNLAKHFDDLKEYLKDAPYFDDIAFKEFEVDARGNPKPIDIREVIALLSVFDKDNFSENVHPLMAYSSKNATLKHFRSHRHSFEKIYPLANDILLLYDHIQEHLPALYNKARKDYASVSGGRFGQLTGVTYKKDKLITDLPYAKKKIKYGIPDGFIYPILGAFRAVVEEKDGKYVWGPGMDPIKMIDGPLGTKLADTIGNFALETQNPSKTGKSQIVWQSCYQAVENAYLRAKQAPSVS